MLSYMKLSSCNMNSSYNLCLAFLLAVVSLNNFCDGSENENRDALSRLPTYREKQRLPKYRLRQIPLKSDYYTISGHSSGSAAATQYYLSYPDGIEGIAVYSSIHYLCGSGSLATLLPCLRGWGNSTDSIRLAEHFAQTGLIEPLDHMWGKRHYVFHGNGDPVIHHDSGVKTFEFFEHYSPNVMFRSYNAAHSLPTKTCGISCGGIPSNPGTGCSLCDFSAVYDSLNYLYKGTLVEPTTTTCRPKYDRKGLVFVDQAEFMPPFGERKTSMLPDAVLYTPPQCIKNTTLCTLHVNFHGCRHSVQNDGMDYIKCSGFLELADSNDFMVLFPQVRQSPLDTVTLFHCWDMYGYTGPLFGTKLGNQNQVIARMMDRIFGLDGFQVDDDLIHEFYRVT